MPTSAASNNFCCNNTKFVLITIYRNCWSVEACISSKKYRENVNMEKKSFTVWGRASRLRHVAARRRVCARLYRAVRIYRRDHIADFLRSTERVSTRAPPRLRRGTLPLPRPLSWFPSHNRARVNTRPPRLRRGTLPLPRPLSWFPSHNRARVNTRPPRLRRGTLPPPRLRRGPCPPPRVGALPHRT